MTAILCFSLFSMQPSKTVQYSVSKFQIGIQCLSYIGFTLTDFVNLILPAGTFSWNLAEFISISANIFGLLVLTWTLCTIADLQLEQESREFQGRESIYSTTTRGAESGVIRESLINQNLFDHVCELSLS